VVKAIGWLGSGSSVGVILSAGRCWAISSFGVLSYTFFFQEGLILNDKSL